MAHLMQINIQHLRTKQFTLTQYSAEANPDVILINETHLTPDRLPVYIHGYTSANRRDSQNGAAGGVAIYCKEDLHFSPINHPNFLQDTTAISISIPPLGEVAVITHYTPPYPNSHITNDIFQFFISNFRHCIFMGDYNSHHPFINNKGPNPRGLELYSILQAHHLELLNAGGSPTHLNAATGTSSLLDLAIATPALAGKLQQLWVGEDIGSDHLPLHITFQGPLNPTPPPVQMGRNLRRANWTVFKEEVTRKIVSFQPTLINDSSVADELVDYLQDVLETSLEKACPTRPIKKRSFRISKETLQLIRTKRTARRLAL